MANPNIAGLTTAKGKTVGLDVPTGTGDLVSTVPTDEIYKINSIIVTNVDGSNAAEVTVFIDRASGTNLHLAYSASVPAKTSLVVTSKENQFYLEEGNKISVSASAAGDLEAICSYEEIS